ncbi:hypothetical protein A1QO_02490 [Vibrio genomosp. F10 str. ZF-129]|uniref:Uncharacterized protein n=1 Tax=Vibrio genomosp. F10 str. ZF-129 TaxID=1187848 RepID=A0A1E5BKI4_9VIBR|nr:hypothetical protein [Vibrio genomosp. F10]OEE38265.1 hypothetical protein A1QO_02490 [Vibrio genomosp. F10 str. ZF-129]
MSMKLLEVAEGILDNAAQEYINENLSSLESVKAYGNGCDIYLSDAEAKQVFDVCKTWLCGTESGELNGTNDYYHTVKKPLLGSEATL